MREIKFRAWVPAQQKIYGPVTLDEMQAQWSYPLHWCQPLMQYTGLKDANGVEIYEGDIVEVFGTASQVMYSKSNASFRYQHIAAPHSIEALGNYSAPAFKVIGNIHEHPELLNTH